MVKWVRSSSRRIAALIAAVTAAILFTPTTALAYDEVDVSCKTVSSNVLVCVYLHLIPTTNQYGQPTTKIQSWTQLSGSNSLKKITRVETYIQRCVNCSPFQKNPTSDAAAVSGSGTIYLHNSGWDCNSIYEVRPYTEYQWYDATHKTWLSGSYYGKWYIWTDSHKCTENDPGKEIGP